MLYAKAPSVDVQLCMKYSGTPLQIRTPFRYGSVRIKPALKSKQNKSGGHDEGDSQTKITTDSAMLF